ncbi:hypothetical protein ACIQNU_37280 [Streptomyces sp. NPDC091292]|uniref:hypothetical protein n=1 Tax=Streptomyces sp. NPDC091292 TaxID=3365991 RepID=UPI0037F523ED
MPQLDAARRDALAEEFRRALGAYRPGCRAVPLGSLAAGTADAYSDIDLLWVVPDEIFGACVAGAADCLGQVLPVTSLRADPDLQRSAKHRLLFVTFTGLPLFWRLDLVVRAASVADDDRFDVGNPAARGDDWSPAASALANAVASVKAVCRDRPELAVGLLARGLHRVGAPDQVTGVWADDIARLTRAAVAADPATADLAHQVTRLTEEFLPAER